MNSVIKVTQAWFRWDIKINFLPEDHSLWQEMSSSFVSLLPNTAPNPEYYSMRIVELVCLLFSDLLIFLTTLFGFLYEFFSFPAPYYILTVSLSAVSFSVCMCLCLQLVHSISAPHFHIQFSSVQFSRSVVSDSLWPHESQHARPPCPSPTPGVHSDSRP